MKKIFATMVALVVLFGTQQVTTAAQVGDIRLMRGYDWSQLDGNEEAIYLAGALEGFFFRLYSAVDPTKEEQVQSYNKLQTCVQKERALIQRSFNTSLALGRDLEHSFPDILWNQIVPLVCEGRQQLVSGGKRGPLRFVSHAEWNEIPKNQKKLFLKGYLEAQLHLLTRQPDSQKKSQDLILYAQIVTDTGQSKTLELLDKYGLEPDLPIPWSIARANGSLIKRGPGYPSEPTAEGWINRTTTDLLEGYFAWIDLEALNAVCQDRWKKSGGQSFTEAFRAEIMRQHKCLAEKIVDPLLPTFFSELGTPQREIEKMAAQLSPKLIQEKTTMARRHFSGLSNSAQGKLCSDNWGLASSSANAPYFRARQIEYDLTRIPQAAEANILAKSVVSDCRMAGP